MGLGGTSKISKKRKNTPIENPAPHYRERSGAHIADISFLFVSESGTGANSRARARTHVLAFPVHACMEAGRGGGLFMRGAAGSVLPPGGERQRAEVALVKDGLHEVLSHVHGRVRSAPGLEQAVPRHLFQHVLLGN
jgi:hypothetical protein